MCSTDRSFGRKFPKIWSNVPFFQNGLTFMKSDKVEDADEITIPSDLDDPNNGKLLSELVGRRRYVMLILKSTNFNL